MSANANAAFMNNLRPASNAKPAIKARQSRAFSSAASSDDKENQVNHVSADTSTASKTSRLLRPRSAASILESKSSGKDDMHKNSVVLLSNMIFWGLLNKEYCFLCRQN